MHQCTGRLVKPVFEASPKKLPLNSREQQHWNTGNDALASLNIIAISSNKSNRGEVKRLLKIEALLIHTQKTATPKQDTDARQTRGASVLSFKHTAFSTSIGVFAMHIYRHIGV